jgi:O-antigen/teichoic acid export membrane protein
MLKFIKIGKLTENTIYSYFAILTSILFGLFSKILLAKVLTVSEVGLFITTQTFFIFVMFASGEWLSDSVVYHVAKNSDNKKILKNIYYKSLLIGLSISLTFTTVYIIAKFFIFDTLFENKIIFIILLLWIFAIPFRVISGLIGALFQGLNNLKIKIIYNDILPYFFIIICLTFLYMREVGSLIYVIIVYITSYFLCSLILILKSSLFFNNKKVEYFQSARLIRYGTPLFFAGLVNWPLASMPILIAFLDNLNNVTFYTFTLSIVVLISLPISAIEPALFPYWTNKLKTVNKNKVFEKLSDISFITFLISTVLFVPIFCCSESIIKILFGSNYLQISEYVKYLSIFVLLVSIFGPLDSVLKALGETKSLFKARLIEAFCVLVLIIPSTYYFGIKGSFLTYVIAGLCGLIYFSYIIVYKKSIFYLNKNYLLNLASIIIFIFVECIFIQNFFYLKNDFLNIFFVTFLHLFFMFVFLLLTGHLKKIINIINEINLNI